MRDSFLPFALPDLGEVERQHLLTVLDSGWITTGPKTRQFEQEFAASVGASHSLAVNSCTAAMHLALEAIGLKAGDLVVTTPYTFAATAEVIRYFDALPLFVDVEPETFNMDTKKLAEAGRDFAKPRAGCPAFLAAGHSSVVARPRTRPTKSHPAGTHGWFSL